MPAIGIAAALLAAIAIGHIAHAGPSVAIAVCVAAGWLVVITALNAVVDVTGLSNSSGGTGFIVGQLVADIGALAVVGATAAIGARFLRS